MRHLRDDQTEALSRLRASVAAGKRRVVMQAPTGFGKTVLAAGIVESARAKGKRALFTVPALSLVDQTVEMFYGQGIRDIGVIQASHCMTDWSQPVQIASVQTLQKRTIPEADVVLVDEVHRWHKFYEGWFFDPKWANIPIIGLSATPWSKGLGSYFKELIIAGTTAGLIERGLLSRFRVFAPSHPDLAGVRTVAGDYHEGELSARMNKDGLVGNIVETWGKLGEGRPTLCFAVDRLHAQHLQQRFIAAGVQCGYQDAYTPDGERATIKRKFHSGEYRVVCNIGTLTVGIDWDVRCISMARPTKSEILFTQIVGRGLRTAPDKRDCLILDHADNHLRLGFVTDIDMEHTALHSGKVPLSAPNPGPRLPKECPKCAFLKPPRTAKCPSCGHVVEAHSKIEEATGTLAEVNGKKNREFPDTPTGRLVTFAGLRWLGQSKGFKEGWAANQYREIYGKWPGYNIKGCAPTAPSMKLMDWVDRRLKYWRIKKAKGAAKYQPQQSRAERDEAIVAGVKEQFVPGTLCTQQDLDDFGRLG